MTRGDASGPKERRTRFAEAIAAHRRRGTEAAVFRGHGPGDPCRIRYTDRTLTLDCSGDERTRLDDLLDDYPVFKIEGPATRKAPQGRVHVSAIADPKHAADFVEDAFRRVYALPEDYTARVSQE